MVNSPSSGQKSGPLGAALEVPAAPAAEEIQVLPFETPKLAPGPELAGGEEVSDTASPDAASPLFARAMLAKPTAGVTESPEDQRLKRLDWAVTRLLPGLLALAGIGLGLLAFRGPAVSVKVRPMVGSRVLKPEAPLRLQGARGQQIEFAIDTGRLAIGGMWGSPGMDLALKNQETGWAWKETVVRKDKSWGNSFSSKEGNRFPNIVARFRIPDAPGEPAQTLTGELVGEVEYPMTTGGATGRGSWLFQDATSSVGIPVELRVLAGSPRTVTGRLGQFLWLLGGCAVLSAGWIVLRWQMRWPKF